MGKRLSIEIGILEFAMANNFQLHTRFFPQVRRLLEESLQ